ncbi:hypothetical protein ASD30_04690 [Nocardioides sp. Root140]|nr:hypothetical protein ASD30_04690 [Nocardioides sp. Root140]
MAPLKSVTAAMSMAPVVRHAVGMDSFDPTDVYGVPETDLPPELVGTLPGNSAPAPWSVRASAVVWWSKATPAATAALPASVRERGRAVAVVGGLVRYADTPVGTYDEVFGAVAVLFGRGLGRRLVATIPFMAVDSPSSLVGGRANWSIPKTLADFSGAPADGTPFTASSATGAGWQVSATARAKGPRLPVVSRARVAQEFPDHSLRGTRLKARGRMRLSRVEADVSSVGELPGWLPSGRHPGALLDDVRFSLDVPRPM